MIGIGFGNVTSTSSLEVPGYPGGVPNNSMALLDMLSVGAQSDASHLYSISRKLRTAYVGPLINVRRASDGATTDIGVNGDDVLNYSTLLSFIEAGSGVGSEVVTITTIYEQSASNNYDLVQVLTARQPILFDSGTYYNSPTGAFVSYADGTREMQSSIATGFSLADFSIFTVNQTNDLATKQNLFLRAHTNGFISSAVVPDGVNPTQIVSRVREESGAKTNFYRGDTKSDTDWFRFNVRGSNIPTGVNNAEYNGTTLGASSLIPGGSVSNDLHFILSKDNSDYFIGKFSEMMIFSSQISDVDTDLITNNQATFYGT